MLDLTTRAALNTLGPALLEAWQASGNEPWSLTGIIEKLGELGWPMVGTPAAWLKVRT
ncbi:MAG: hypothetical protein WCS37_12725 [Chloroflexota bacterium]|nr:hypothetical protein [Chloroflexota bacterium]